MASGCFLDRGGLRSEPPSGRDASTSRDASVSDGSVARDDGGPPAGADAGEAPQRDAGLEPIDDAGTSDMDAGAMVDAGPPSGRDAGPARIDGGVDAGFDAGIDARFDAGIPVFVGVETLTIPCTTSTVQVSATVLRSDATWRLRASGTCTIAPGIEADANYFGFPDMVADARPTIDPAIGVDDSSINASTTPNWGPYEPSHVYEIDIAGTDAPISVRYHDGVYSNNAGSLTLEILELR